MPRIFSDNEFTDRVKQYLLDKHEVAYVSHFYYNINTDNDPLPPYVYTLEWLENNQDKPMVMMGDFETEDEFFTYVCKEIDTKRFWLKRVFTLKHADKPTDPQNKI